MVTRLRRVVLASSKAALSLLEHTYPVENGADHCPAQCMAQRERRGAPVGDEEHPQGPHLLRRAADARPGRFSRTRLAPPVLQDVKPMFPQKTRRPFLAPPAATGSKSSLRDHRPSGSGLATARVHAAHARPRSVHGYLDARRAARHRLHCRTRRERSLHVTAALSCSLVLAPHG